MVDTFVNAATFRAIIAVSILHCNDEVDCIVLCWEHSVKLEKCHISNVLLSLFVQYKDTNMQYQFLRQQYRN